MESADESIELWRQPTDIFALKLEDFPFVGDCTKISSHFATQKQKQKKWVRKRKRGRTNGNLNVKT